MSKNIVIDVQESNEEVNGSNSRPIEQNDNLADYSVLDVHSTPNEVSTFIMSMIASTPNIDVNNLEKILLEKTRYFAKMLYLVETDDEIGDMFCALHAACLLNNFKLVKLFVEHGANVNLQTSNGFTPLHMYLSESLEINMDIVDYLINHGTDLTLENAKSQTPLYFAVCRNHVAAVNSILQHPCNVNKVSVGGVNALMAAASRSLEIVNMLLDSGADPNIVNSDNEMALHFSLFSNDEDIFTRLLQVSKFEDKPKSFSLLLKAIIDKNNVDCLEALVESDYKELLVKTTLELSDNFYSFGRYKEICLLGYLITKGGYWTTKKMFDIIITNGYTGSHKSPECVSPLSVAATHNTLKDAEYYIEKLISADVNYPQADVLEALLLSCKYYNFDITRILLRHCIIIAPDHVLKGLLETYECDISDIPSEFFTFFLTVGMTPSAIQLIDSYELIHKITDFNTLTTNVCTLKQLCRISVRQLFYSKYKTLSISEIMKMINLPSSIWKYLRYEDS